MHSGASVSSVRRSGLTIAEFCAEERLAAKSFYDWRRRLRLVELADRRPTPPAPAAFLPVTVRVAEHNPHEARPIEADLPNGVRLRIPTADARLACRLVRVVAQARTDGGAR